MATVEAMHSYLGLPPTKKLPPGETPEIGMGLPGNASPRLSRGVSGRREGEALRSVPVGIPPGLWIARDVPLYARIV